MKLTPSLLAYLISPTTGRLWSYLQLPPLSTGKVWVGDENNVAIESDFTPLGNYLPEGQVYVGNSENVATPSQTISINNLPDLPGATITVDNPLDPGNTVTISGGLIWEGGGGVDGNRPEESSKMLFMELDITLINLRFLLAHFVMNSPGAGDSLRILMPNSQFLIDLGLNTIPKVGPAGILVPAIPDVDYVTMATFEEWITVLQDEIDAIVSDITQIQAELLVINDEINSIMAELTVINDEIAVLQNDLAALEIDVAALIEDVEAIQAELVVINGEIDAINAELVVITADIATIQGQIVVIQGQIATLFGNIASINADITAIWAAIAVLQAQVASHGIDIDIIFNDIDELQDQVDALQNEVDNLNLQLQAHIAQSDILFEDLSDAIYAVNVRIDDLRLNTIPADDNVSIYGFRLTDVQDPIDDQDAATKLWTENLIGGLPSDMTITLVGDVSGSGPADEPIETTFNRTLNEIPNAGDVDIAGYQLKQVADPTEEFDAVNESFMWRFLNGEIDVEWAA